MICFQSNAVPQASARKRYIRPLQANILAIFPSYTTFVRFKIQYDGRKEKNKALKKLCVQMRTGVQFCFYAEGGGACIATLINSNPIFSRKRSARFFH